MGEAERVVKESVDVHPESGQTPDVRIRFICGGR
jgi:hypothetical protein